MAKYSFERLSADTFEALVKALLHQEFGLDGQLVIFGPGKDGAREATWAQSPDHPKYVRPRRLSSKNGRDRSWVFQVKYHDTSAARSRPAIDGLIQDINSELDKIVNKHKVPCDTYVLITNLPLTGARHVGGRDRIEKAALPWRTRIDRIEIWDTAKLSSLLDAHPDIRQTYLDAVLPGDLIASLLCLLHEKQDRRAATIRTYLEKVVKTAGSAKSDEAGDDADNELRLEDIYIDLTLTLDVNSLPRDDAVADVVSTWSDIAAKRIRPPFAASHSYTTAVQVPASLALLLAANSVTLLEAGPGYGKSTLCQFAVVYHALRLCGPDAQPTTARLTQRMSQFARHFHGLDSLCTPRLPFRIELRRYADWRADQDNDSLAQYIAEKLINPDADASLNKEDVYDLLRTTPSLLVLDGLDEVPNRDARARIITDAEVFLRRARTGERADVQVIVSTRPQGYNQEFAPLSPLTWTIDSLSTEQFYEYCASWLARRVPDCNEQADALIRVKHGMSSPDVERLAFTLLQATVILTIAKNKSDIPHERSGLFRKYVDVIFAREKIKSGLVKLYESELHRLHELTGYELHRMMEHGQSGAIGEQQFRDLVRRVWETYRGDTALPSGLKPVIDNIISAARNRLVFLKGEGANQNEIGFLISSFREYFAAQYLHADEDAVREKVFEALLSREAHWENVLLFYGGFQEASAQREWLDYSQQQDDTEPQRAEALVHAVKFRRMLLKLLPEFRGLRKATFDKAIQEVLSRDTMWTWVRCGWAYDIFSSLRGRTVLPLIISLLIDASHGSRPNCRAALTLHAGIVQFVDTERQGLIEHLNYVLNNSELADLAVGTAISFDIPLALDHSAIDACVRAMTERRYNRVVGRREVLKQFPLDAVLQLLLRGGWQSRALSNLPLLTGATRPRGAGRPYHAVRVSQGFGIAAKPYAAGGTSAIEFAEYCPIGVLGPIVNENGLATTAAGRYVASLWTAAKAPWNPLADETARQLERDPAVQVAPEYACTHVLGPGTSAFRSDTDWREFRRLASRRAATGGWNKSIKTLRSAMTSKRDLFWLLLVVHPKGWDDLVSSGLVSEGVVTAANENGLRALLSISSGAVDIAYAAPTGTAWSLDQSGVTLAPILSVSLAIAEKHGSECLASSPWFAEFVGGCAFKQSSSADFTELARRAQDLPDLPREWLFALLVLGIRTPEREIVRLLELWQRLDQHPPDVELGASGRLGLRHLVRVLLRSGERTTNECCSLRGSLKGLSLSLAQPQSVPPSLSPGTLLESPQYRSTSFARWSVGCVGCI